MKIYNVLVEYTNFEDEDNNYSEIRGSFSTKEKAIKKIKEELEEQIDMDMVYRGNFSKNEDELIKEDIKKFGYLYLEQDFGFGETRIILSENELDKE